MGIPPSVLPATNPPCDGLTPAVRAWSVHDLPSCSPNYSWASTVEGNVLAYAYQKADREDTQV